MLTKICTICGTNFGKNPSITKYRLKNQKYCSNSCRYKGVGMSFRGENNPKYKGGTVIDGHSYFKCITCTALTARKGHRCRKCWDTLLREDPTKHPCWGKRKENISYKHLHKWMNDTFGKPIECEFCHRDNEIGRASCRERV